MKKILIILLIFSTTILNACNNKEQDNSKIELQAVEISENIKVEVDPRIELLTTIQYLADYKRISRINSKYKDDIDEYFKYYKDHEAVVQFKELSKRNFNYEGPIDYILNCTQLPDLQLSENISYSSKQLQVGVKDLDEFRKEVKRFYKDSNFKEFYNNHEELYTDIISKYTEDSQIKKDILALENYHGYKQNSYNIILSPLIHSGGYGPNLNEDNGRYDAYQVVGPIISQEIYEEYDKDKEKIKNIKDIVKLFEINKSVMIHEFNHTYLNNTIEKPYFSMINDKKPKTDKYLKSFPKSYSDWNTIVNEYFVRAITARVLFLQNEKEEYENAIKNDKKSGFEHIEKLTEKLKQYENNRDKYKQIEDFYPKLLDELVKQYY